MRKVASGQGPVISDFRIDCKRRGVTLLELLVAMGVLLVAMLSISKIFTITTDASGIAAAHAEVLQAAASIRERLERELGRIAPDGLLVIDSPAPTQARTDIPNGPKITRIRQDRLVFIASAGTTPAYQSYTHRWASSIASPDRSSLASTQALIYFGPGIPVDGDGTVIPFDDETIALSSSKWTLAHRATLFLDRIPADTDMTNWAPMDTNTFEATMLAGGALNADIRDGKVDVIVDGDPTAVLGSYLPRLADLLQAKLPGDMTSANPSIKALWEPCRTPLFFSLINSAGANYYTRTGNLLAPRLAEFRIEWTDGRPVNSSGVNPNMNLRWFGLVPDGTMNPDPANPDAQTYIALRRQDVTAETTAGETATFANEIEYAASGNAATNIADYRAIWRKGNWDQRPKALRFTFRLFDANNRLRSLSTIDNDEDGDPDPDGPTQIAVNRYGEEISFVMPLN